MRPHRLFDNRYDLANWISGSANFNTFITLTLKQGLLDDTFRGQVRPINRDDCVKTAWLFRDRLARKVLHSTRLRHGERLPLASFVEGGDFQRFHLHIVVERPAAVTFLRIASAACQVTENLPWVHNRIDTRPIDYGCPEWVVNYCLEDGTDAFLPEASCLHA
jgi:hypothetical protein